MTNDAHKIDVIIPVHNGERYLKKAVTSVLEQSLLPNKIIIINDSSTDNTQNIINELKNQSDLIVSTKVSHSWQSTLGVEDMLKTTIHWEL